VYLILLFLLVEAMVVRVVQKVLMWHLAMVAELPKAVLVELMAEAAVLRIVGAALELIAGVMVRAVRYELFGQALHAHSHQQIQVTCKEISWQ
jgi:hypothetical protein